MVGFGEASPPQDNFFSASYGGFAAVASGKKDFGWSTTLQTSLQKMTTQVLPIKELP
jgi:hypothetical protein